MATTTDQRTGSAPLVGLTGRGVHLGDAEPVALRGQPAELFLSAYPQAVARAGGVPVYLSRVAAAEEVVGRLDGLLLTGGEDVEPTRYGGTDEGVEPPDPARDRFELALLGAARARGLPVLAICRGIQLVNVWSGGTLVAHLGGDAGRTHTALDRPHEDHRHPVTTTAGSTLHDIYGPSAEVNSLHHQAVDILGPGLQVCAVAPDGVIEALESEDGGIVAVQWHPELQPEVDGLFRWLVERAAAGSRAEHLDGQRLAAPGWRARAEPTGPAGRRG